MGYLQQEKSIVYKEDKLRRCESEEDYYNYIQTLTLTFELLAEQRAEESEFSKMEFVKAGTAHLPNVVKAIERYVVQNPKLSDRAYEDLTNYVTRELLNFIGQEATATANAVIHATPNIQAPKIDDAPVTRDELQQVLAALTDQLHSIHVRLPRQGSRKPAYSLPHHMSPAPNPPRATRATGAPTRATYCFLYGFARNMFARNMMESTAVVWEQEVYTLTYNVEQPHQHGSMESKAPIDGTERKASKRIRVT